MTNEDPLPLLIWNSSVGDITIHKLDLGGFDVSLGHTAKLSLHNPNEKLWCDISKLHTILNDTWIEKPYYIPPLNTIEITYKIGSKEDSTISDSHKDRIEGELRWSELEYVEKIK